MELKAEMSSMFNPNNFKKSFMITWMSVVFGFFIIFLLFIIASQTPKNSVYSYILQNIGLFMLFSSLLLGLAGVHRLNINLEGSSIMGIFKDISRRSHYILVISLIVVLFLFGIVLLEVGFSLFGHIPYIGSVIVLLLTIPLFSINFICLIISLSVILITPLMIGEGKSLIEIGKDFTKFFKEKWFYTALYLFVSFILLILGFIIVYYFTRYSVGVTKAVQWKINAAYPKFLDIASTTSLLTDFAEKMVPEPDPIAAFKKYGFEILNYLAIVRHVISFFYIILFSLIVSFPLAAYYSLSSIFYKWIRG
ncbi:MAG: hypothetical protein SVZ03_13995 [Spirochaetota bacterium]|nr:hypothetical protein [Spirochaetota bacterium]